jgi:hypothetical protein
VNPRNLNRKIHALCLKVMEASCLINEGQRNHELAELLPSITELVDHIEGSHADEVLSGPALTTYGWLYKQRKEILESLVSEDDLDSMFLQLEGYLSE